MILTSDGMLWAYGSNKDGSIPLQQSHYTDQYIPNNINSAFGFTDHKAKDIVELRVGNHYTLFRMRDHSIYCAGVNSHGQCGDKTNLNLQTPKRIDNLPSSLLNGFNATRILACPGHSFVWNDEGRSVLGFGYNEYGQLGIGKTYPAQYVPDAMDLSSVLGDAPDTRIMEVVCGGAHTLIHVSDGSVWGVGNNLDGQYGQTPEVMVSRPVAVPFTNELTDRMAKQVATGYSHSLILTTDGKIFALGSGDKGQLGDGIIRRRSFTPVLVDVDKFIVEIVCGDNHNMALASTGELYAWGEGLYGALGNGDIKNQPKPVLVTPQFPVPGDSIVQIRCGQASSLLVTAHGDILTTGFNGEGNLGDFSTLHERSTFSNGPTFSLGALSMPPSLNDQMYSLASSADGASMLLDSGTLSKLLADEYRTILGGFGHIMLLSQEGKAFGIGENAYGQLGDSTRNNAPTQARPVHTDGVLRDKKILQIATGYVHTLFLTSEGKVSCAGKDSEHQCGIATVPQQFVPSPQPVNTDGVLKDKRISEVAADELYSLALSDDGFVFSWGSGFHGELGATEYVLQAPVPVAVDTSGVLHGKSIVSISAGGIHALALSLDGKVYIWGNGTYGQGGPGFVPAELDLSVLGGTPVLMISSGTQHSLLLAADGRVLAFGRSNNGQLGTGLYGPNVYEPIPVVISYMGALSQLDQECRDSKRAIAVTANSGYSSIQLSHAGEPSCFGYHYKSVSVCSGHGACVADNSCQCAPGYGGSRCSLYACGSVLAQNSTVCHGHGTCVAPETCQCEEGYSSLSYCNTPYCFRKTMDNPSDRAEICSGRGECIGPNKCECPWNYSWDSHCAFNVLSVIALCGILTGVCLGICCLATCCACILTGLRFERRKRHKAESKAELTETLLKGFIKDSEMDEVDADSQRAKLIIRQSMFEIDFNELEGLEKIGHGGSGAIVFKGKFRGNQVAVKVFKSALMDGEAFFADFEHEVSMMGSLRHKNLVNFMGCSVVYPRIAIIMEYCALGSVYSLIEDGAFAHKSLRDILHMLLDVCEGMLYLHSFNVIHRDLKCENVFVDQNGNIKIGDFGLSKFATDTQARHTMAVGTSRYMAPEVLRESSEGYDLAVDVFSFSILAYEMLNRKLRPYPAKMSDYEVQNRVSSDPTFRPDLSALDVNSDVLKELLRECWNHDPKDRPKFEEIIERLRSVLREV